MPAFRYQTPGVYHERLDASAPAVTSIRTDVAGFVGLARRGLLDTPVPVQSWRQFEAHFGGFTGAGYLAYAVRAFFENGGRRCWIVRVASKEAAGGAHSASIVVPLVLPPGTAAWRIAASSPGLWGNALAVALRETHRAQTLTDPLRSSPEAAGSLSTSGFARYSLARISQPGVGPVFKVVSDVDPYDGAIRWVHPETSLRTPYDSPLTGFDPDRPLLIESIEYALQVYELGRPLRLYENLSLIPEHARYGPRLLAPLTLPEECEHRGELPPTPEPVVIDELRSPPLLDIVPLDVSPTAVLSLSGGADGLALLRPYDFMGEALDPRDSDFVRARKERGFRALDRVDEVAAVAVPDIHIRPAPPVVDAPIEPCEPDPCLVDEEPEAAPREPVRTEEPPIFPDEDVFLVQDALVQICETRRDRIALLDPPVAASLDEQEGISTLIAWRRRFDSDFAALYWPWLRVVDPLRREGMPGSALTRDVPPSGHAAGQIARSDFAVGVHKAAANVPLGWVQDVSLTAHEADLGGLNTLGVNVIRSLPGRGIRIMGGRTLSSDAQWRFLNVRRLFMMIAKAVYISVQWAAFEPNDTFTRSKLRLALTSFLLALWQRGALVGATAAEAFFVRCDETTMTQADVDNGRLICLVGAAPSQPYEFVVVRVGRADNEFEISEFSTSVRGT